MMFVFAIFALTIVALLVLLARRRRVLERQIAAYRAERRRLIIEAAVSPYPSSARVDIHFEGDRRRWS